MAKPSIKTLGELKKSGYQPRSVRDEIRTNLMTRLREGQPIFEGIVGYEQTVIPQIVNALLSRHNLILLGLRGQAKTRLLRQIAALLDEWLPVVAGSEVNDDPFHPISRFGRDLVATNGDATEIEWIHRDDRYREKLATPDVSVADLIGDLDPVKAATHKLSFSHEGAINYGIIPRTNRGVFAINELPDLQPRIQVSLFNILEEKDVQIRGFPVRLPMDILLVFTANPEDYTNRGSIITPLKDRIESQILTHYPTDIAHAMAITEQEAWQSRKEHGEVEVVVPPFVRRIVERVAFEARKSEFVDQASGVSARLPIAALENVVSNAERRAAINGTKREVARVIDLQSAIPAMTGKVELVYEGEQEGTLKVATNLLGTALRAEFEEVFPSAYKQTARGGRRRRSGTGTSVGGGAEQVGDTDHYKPVIDAFSKGLRLEMTDTLPYKDYRAALDGVAGLAEVVKEHAPTKDEQEFAVRMELVLEGLHQSSLLAKEDIDRGILYCDMLGTMFEDFD